MRKSLKSRLCVLLCVLYYACKQAERKGKAMKRNEITIDINKLTTDELYQLMKMVSGSDYNGSFNREKRIQDRIAFQEGWMCEEDEAKYYTEFCAA